VAPSAIAPRGVAHAYQGRQPLLTPRAPETSEIADLEAIWNPSSPETLGGRLTVTQLTAHIPGFCRIR